MLTTASPNFVKFMKVTTILEEELGRGRESECNVNNTFQQGMKNHNNDLDAFLDHLISSHKLSPEDVEARLNKRSALKMCDLHYAPSKAIKDELARKLMQQGEIFAYEFGSNTPDSQRSRSNTDEDDNDSNDSRKEYAYRQRPFDGNNVKNKYNNTRNEGSNSDSDSDLSDITIPSDYTDHDAYEVEERARRKNKKNRERNEKESGDDLMVDIPDEKGKKKSKKKRNFFGF